jgi:hypothetical protein
MIGFWFTKPVISQLTAPADVGYVGRQPMTNHIYADVVPDRIKIPDEAT